MFWHELFLTFFYSGKAKKMSGTVGSLATIPLWIFGCFFMQKFALDTSLQIAIWIIFSVILTIYGSVVIPSYLKHFGYEEDHGSIVLDETIGQILALTLSYFYFAKYYFSDWNFVAIHIISAFILFRFFDIRKPWIIGIIDRKVKGGIGVILDDIVSGIVAGLIIVLAFIFLN